MWVVRTNVSSQMSGFIFRMNYKFFSVPEKESLTFDALETGMKFYDLP